MAAGVLSAPGTAYGPCEGDCQHRDCALTREMATLECIHCDEPIGYGVRFYEVDRFRTHSLAPLTRVLAHALCEERRIDEAQGVA